MADIAGHYERTLVADRAAIDEESRTVPASLSTSDPIEQFFGAEILEHQSRSVDLSRASPSLPLLFNHNPDVVIGSVENVHLEGGKLRGLLRFAQSGRGAEIFELVRDGHLRGVSIGYQIIEAQRDGDTDDGLPLYRVTRWRLYEASATPLPRDNKAGIGRSMKRGKEMENEELNETEGKMSRSERRRENRQRQLQDEILEIGDKFGERELAEDVALRGGSVDDLCKEIRDKRNNVQPMGISMVSDREQPSFQEFGRSYSPKRERFLSSFGDNRKLAEAAAYRAGMWLKGCFGDDNAQRWCRDYGVRAGAEGIFSKGGALVPHEMSTFVINLVDQFGVFRRYARVEPMNSDTKSVPRKTGGYSASYVGENTQISDSDLSWDDINLVAKKLAILTRQSNEVIADAAIDLAAFIGEDMARAFAEQEDDSAWNGDGTSTYGGIVGVRPKLVDGNHTAGALDATSGDDTLPEIEAADLDSLIALLPEYAIEGDPAWYVSQAADSVVFQAIARAAGGASVTETGSTIVRSYAGYPIRKSSKLPSNTTANLNNQAMILFGDLSKAATLGSRDEVRIQLLEERFADYDQIGIRGTMRHDIVVHDLGDTSDAGPIVGLVGNS